MAPPAPAPPPPGAEATAKAAKVVKAGKVGKAAKKKQNIPPQPPEGWTRCHAYMERKSRFCRQEVLPCFLSSTAAAADDDDDNDATTIAAVGGPHIKSIYCGNHIHLATEQQQQSGDIDGHDAIDNSNDSMTTTTMMMMQQSNNNKNNKRKRIPCPVDPTHYIFADMLQKHVKKCPKTVAHQRQAQLHFYRENCNCGGHGRRGEEEGHVNNNTEPSIGTTTTSKNDLEWAKRVAVSVLQVHQQLFLQWVTTTGTMTKTEQDATGGAEYVITADLAWQNTPAEVVGVVAAARTITCQSIAAAIPLLDLAQPELDAGLAAAVADHRIKSGGSRKHLHQQASLIGHLRRIGMFGPAARIPPPSSSSLPAVVITAAARPTVTATTATTNEKQQNYLFADHQQQPQKEEEKIDTATKSVQSSSVSVDMRDDATIGTGSRGGTPCPTTSTNTTIFRTILEMGAGRGMTGLVVAGVSAATNYNYFITNNTHCGASTGTTETSPQVTVTTHLTMIERSASRSRAEQVLRKVKKFADSFPNNDNKSGYLNLSAVEWDRIQCDLAHVDMKAVIMKAEAEDSLPEQLGVASSGQQQQGMNSKQQHRRELVVIAKHLCGVGTDLALKSLEPIKDKVTACIMSTCCHGVCSWEDYVGRDYLVEAMLQQNRTLLSSFGAAEFELLRLWSSGTVKDDPAATTDGSMTAAAEPREDGDTEEVIDEHTNSSNPHAAVGCVCDDATTRVLNVTKVVEALNLQCGAQGLGRACQRLIDYGRREYLRKVIFFDGTTTAESTTNVELLYYVPDSVTPQNAALIAHR